MITTTTTTMSTHDRLACRQKLLPLSDLISPSSCGSSSLLPSEYFLLIWPSRLGHTVETIIWERDYHLLWDWFTFSLLHAHEKATEDISRQLLQISGLQCLCFLKISDNAFHPHSLQNHCFFVLASSMWRKMCAKTFAVTTHLTKTVATLSLCMDDLLLSRVSNFGIGFPPTLVHYCTLTIPTSAKIL